MKNNNKFAGGCFLVASICYFISAIIGFFNKDSNGMAITHLCLGLCFLCLSSSNFNKDKENKK